MPNRKADTLKFIANIENTITDLQGLTLDEKTILRHQVSNVISSTPSPKSNLTREEHNALSSLRINQDA